MIAVNSTDWFKGADGFYYYKNPVIGHDETKALISAFENSLTAPESTFALHLEMNIVAQAVEYEGTKASVTAAWGSTIAGQLNTL